MANTTEAQFCRSSRTWIYRPIKRNTREFMTNEMYRSTERVIARWEDSQYSVNLVRSRFLNSFALVMFSKRLDAQANAAIESMKLEGQEDPQKEIDRQKKETDDLEAARQKNRKIFRP